MKDFLLSSVLPVLYTAIVFLSSQISAAGQTVVCLKEKISGFDTEYNRAIESFKKTKKEATTSNIKKAAVFITYKSAPGGDFLYFHSNYRPNGYPYPVKIATNESLDLRLITSNIINVKGWQYEFAEAFKKHISFVVDYQIFYHGRFRNLDFSKAENVVIMDAKGLVYADGFKIYKTQKELKKMGFYKGVPDGISGKNTESSMAAFKKAYGLQGEGDFYIYHRNNKKVVSYKEPDDFLKEFEAGVENCQQPLSLCVDDNRIASFAVECNSQSLEFSTEGELTLTASYNNETYTVSIAPQEKGAEFMYAASENNHNYENEVEFLKSYQATYAQVRKTCESSVKLCLGRDTSISFEAECNGNKISGSTTGQVSVTSKYGKSRVVQF